MATEGKIAELIGNGIGQHREYDSRIHVHYDESMFNYATINKGLVVVEANAVGKYHTPPCAWVEKKMPELKDLFMADINTQDRRSNVCKVFPPVAYRFNNKSGITHAVFSYTHGRIRGVPKERLIHYTTNNFVATIHNLIAVAESNKFNHVYLTRIFGSVGGVLFSRILDDLQTALAQIPTCSVQFHFFVPKDPDQSLPD